MDQERRHGHAAYCGEEADSDPQVAPPVREATSYSVLMTNCSKEPCPQCEIDWDHVTSPSHKEVYHTNSSARNSTFFYGIARTPEGPNRQIRILQPTQWRSTRRVRFVDCDITYPRRTCQIANNVAQRLALSASTARGTKTKLPPRNPSTEAFDDSNSAIRYGASLRKVVKRLEVTQHARYTWYVD